MSSSSSYTIILLLSALISKLSGKRSWLAIERPGFESQLDLKFDFKLNIVIKQCSYI